MATDKGFLSLLFVTGSQVTKQLISHALPRETLRQRNVGNFKFCDTGKSALDEYSFNFPDIVFVDDFLPDMPSNKLMQDILADDANAFVVMLCGNVTLELVSEVMQKGGKGVIIKPFSANSFDRYIQFFFKEKYKKNWDEVQTFTDKGQVKR